MANPFARANAMMAVIAAAMSLNTSWERKTALDAIGPYKSRGKGRGGRGTKWLGGSARSKYMPHAGAKERERALRCYMVTGFNAPNGFCPPFPRSAPTMCQRPF